MVTNEAAGTRVDEVATGIYRINTPLDVIPGGFSFNSYLIAGEEPLLFHAGYRKLFPLTLEAIRAVMPVEKLRWIGGSHFEGDEFGSLNEFLAVAPQATPFGSEVGVLTSVNDYAARPARGLPMARSSPSEAAACAGSTRPTFRMDGTAEFSSISPLKLCFAATSSRSRARRRRLSPKPKC